MDIDSVLAPLYCRAYVPNGADVGMDMEGSEGTRGGRRRSVTEGETETPRGGLKRSDGVGIVDALMAAAKEELERRKREGIVSEAREAGVTDRATLVNSARNMLGKGASEEMVQKEADKLAEQEESRLQDLELRECVDYILRSGLGALFK